MARTSSKEPTRAPRDRDLPGMDNRAIADLEELAADYADIRDRRIALNREEGELKARVMAAMRKHKKEIYKREGVEIRIVKGEDDVKVKILADTDATDADEDTAITTPPVDPAPVDPEAPTNPPMFDDPRDTPPAPLEEPAAAT